MNEKMDTAGFNIGNIAGNGKAGNLLNVKGMKRGNWSYFFSPMVRFEENGQNFLFSHSADGNKIKLSSLTSEGEGQVFIDDKWHWYYNSQVPFVENGKITYSVIVTEEIGGLFLSYLLNGMDRKK